MNPNLEGILGKLKKVRGNNGRYTACCPAHQDRSPSLAITEKEDGTILMHCFGGCSVQQIADALAIDLTQLFPSQRDPVSGSAPRRRRFFASDLLRLISFETQIVALCAAQMAKGTPLSPEDRSRLLVAANRVQEALRHADV
ncbi:MAG: CHC2 zinc finger domain-containing protein [bacterium]|jgi:DNA primase